jgi:beta-glucosidase
MPDRRFPPEFRWGTATSSHQVEGNNTRNDWWLFEQQPGRIKDGGRSGLACDWWRNAEADFDRMAALHQNAHRLSLEWSRLEPERGRWDDVAVARYRRMLVGLRERGIEPMITLNHFTLPQWVAAAGGWETPAIVPWFAAYARRCAEWFGEQATQWIPVNEPNIVVTLGYVMGRFPPEVRSPLRAARATCHLLRAHAAAYRAIHGAQARASVGTAHNVRILDPSRAPSLLAERLDRWAADANSWAFNWLWLDVLSGCGAPAVLHLGGLQDCAGTVDFVGVNYYTREHVRFHPWRPENGFLTSLRMPDDLMSDNDYGEVYPDGMRRVLLDVWNRYRRPIYVTENGLPDDDDDLRPVFLHEHLSAVLAAMGAGVPVRGYYYWSLIDNFEWADGWTMKFGLIAVDPFSQDRVERRSARLYAEICRSGGLPDPSALAEFTPRPSDRS